MSGPSSKIFENFNSTSQNRLGPKKLRGDDGLDFVDGINDSFNSSFLSTSKELLTESQISIQNLAHSEPKKAINQLASKYAAKKREIQKLDLALRGVNFSLMFFVRG